MKKKLLSILALLCMTVSGAWAASPTGELRSLDSYNGSIYINGWAYDPDAVETSISVDYYIYTSSNNPGSSMVKSGRLPANGSNSHSWYIISGNHEFGGYIDVSDVTSGTYYICVYALDTSGTGNTTIHGAGGASSTYEFSITVKAPYSVTYNANGGSGAPSAQKKSHNIVLTLSSTVPTRTGYTFAGWNTKDDGTGTSYAAGASYTANADVTLYAQWTQNTATLTDGEGITALSTWSGKTCTVTYTRSFTSGKASTVCLPFAYAPKTGETFYTFSGITKDGDNYVATMTEAATSPLTANTPYLYVKSATGDTDFSGTYTIPATISAGETTSGDWKFVGTYETQEWTTAPTGIYGFSAQAVDGISQGEFVKVGAYVRIKPMRAYLKYKDGGEDYAGAPMMAPRHAAEVLPERISVRLIDAEGNVTGIGTLETRTGEVTLDGWYTLDGTRLSGQPTQKGIYVNNGKKVVIK